MLCELIGEPIKQSAELIEEPIKRSAELIGEPIKQSAQLIGEPIKQSAELIGEPIKQSAQLIGEPIKRSAQMIGEPIKGRVKTGTLHSTGSQGLAWALAVLNPEPGCWFFDSPRCSCGLGGMARAQMPRKP